MKEKLVTLLEQSIDRCFEAETLKRTDIPFIEVDLPREGAHGDYATNIAMVLAASQHENPRMIAGLIVDNIGDNSIVEKIDIAGPGFINFFIAKEVWATLLQEVEKQGLCYGQSDLGRGTRVQVEFVSANPTGPLHIGHARGAVIGDVIANVLQSTGVSVSREYYINDAGNQMNNLGRSVWFRYLELLGKTVAFPPDCYQGDYIVDLARDIYEEHGTDLRARGEAEAIPFLTGYAAGSILQGIQDDLRAFGVTFDCYFSEKELYRDDGVERLLSELQDKGYVYREGKTLWFKTTDFDDEKDRVVIRENGDPTYFAADIAYHKNKYARGFDRVIDVWGADHHGYIPRMYAGIQAVGQGKESLDIVLVQLVNLLRDGVPVAMSTRAGEFTTLREVIDEVGKDAARYNFLMRRSNSHLDFDLELAKKESNENPVYYVQYAHARISSILRTAVERGHQVPRCDEVNLSLLTEQEEYDIIKLIDRFPELIEGSAQALEPHRIPFYINDLAALFHSYYNKHRVVSDDADLTRARLFLIKSLRTVFGNALRLLGVSAPERM